MSTALFSLLIFFSVTGITLNHLDWVTGKKQPQLLQGHLPKQVTEGFSPPVSDDLLRWLKAEHGLAAAKGVEWDDEVQEVLLDYPYPAGFAYVIVNIEDGRYSIDYQTGTFWQVMNDLHKGRHAGRVWGGLIDVSAVLMVLLSITGLIILWQNRPKRRAGVVLTLAGTFTPLLIFLFYVPNISGV